MISIFLIAIALVGYVMVSGVKEQVFTVAGSTAPIEIIPPPSINPSDIKSLLSRDSIRAIDDPSFETAELADKNLEPDERVIGVLINGEARAYPIPILSSHEIVNDIVGGEPVAITWCPLCYTALVFSRQVEGQDQPLTFGVSGKLLYNTLVMFDRQTDTLWSQLYGVALEGPLNGTSLDIFPSIHTEWKVWKSQYPETLVLSKTITCEQFGCGTYADSPRFNYEVDPYVSYYNTPREGVIDSQIPRDDFIPSAKKRVLGVRLAGKTRAYPFDIFTRQSVINDVIGGEPILIWFDPESQTGVAFIRQIDNQPLTFFADSDELGTLIDRETGSRWRALTGEAVSGVLQGKKLPGVFVTTAFEFGWFDYFPDSDMYTIPP